MKHRRRALVLLATVILVILLLKSGFHKDVVHLKNDNREFKIRNSIESTILHREKEVYDHVLRSK